MKKNIGKRILSLALALVLVVGLLPMTALKAYAAPSEAETIPTSSTGKHAYSENLTVYYKHDNYLYKVVFSNIKDLEKVGLCFSSSTSSKLQLAGDRGLYLAPTSGTTDNVYISDFPTQTGSSVNFYLRSNVANAVNRGNPVVTVTCMGAGNPTWSWNGTSAATAVFTSTDGNATITVGANITSSIQGATSCLEKDQTTYTATATCNGQTYTDTKTVDGAAGPHSYTYSASGDTLTETCSNNCGHQAIASIVAGEALYTGSEITNVATISYDSGTWAGDEPVLSFENNVNVGTATVKMTAGDATASTTFKINPANISYTTVTFDPENGTYNGNAYAPDVTVTFNGATLVKDTDYTLSWDKNGFITPETYTVRVVGIGNFTGYVDKTFNINAADLDDVEVRQIGTLTYNGGDALTPTVSANAIAVNNQPITFTYCTEQNGIYGSLPSFTEAGTYTVYYKATAPNHNEATGSFTVIVNKAIVTEPTIASKPYTGTVQTADITDTELYTVVKNNGGTGVKLNGYYDVVLELKDAANYKWSSTDNAQVTLQFAITRATNEWTVTPSITGWTYGETAKAPVGSAKFGDVSVKYSGTANDGTQFSSMTAPTKAGNYTATFIVAETEDYSGLETSVDFTIEKADQAAPTGLTKTDTTYFGKADGKISGLTSAMEFRKEGDSTYTVGFKGTLEYLAAGTYYVRYQGDANHNPSPDALVTVNAGRKLQIVVPQNQIGYTVTVNKTEMEYEGNYTLKVEIHEGYTATEDFKIIISNWECGQQAGVEETYMNAIADQIIEVQGVADITAPAAEIKIENNKWSSLWNNLTFGLFFKETQDVTITATDKGSGVKSIEYYLAHHELGSDELEAIANWTEYNGTFKVNPDNQYVIYAKVADNSGNTVYLNSAGIVLDATAPSVYGIEDGGVYYGDKIFKAMDDNFLKIEVDGVDITDTTEGDDEFKIVADNAEHTVTVTDKAGNVTEYKITVYKNYTVTFKADGVTVDTQTVGYGKDATVPTIPTKDGYTQTAPTWDKDGKNITADTEINAVYTINKYTVTYKADGEVVSSVTVEHGKDATAPAIPEKEGYTQTAPTWDKDGKNITADIEINAVYTINKYTVTYKADGEVVDTVTVEHGGDVEAPAVPAKSGYVGKWDAIGKDITKDTTISAVYTAILDVKADEVKPEDKTELEDTKKQLEDMLDDDSYTEDDKKDIQEAIEGIDDALKVIENVEAVEELIGKLPDTIKKDDEPAIKAADDAYNALSDYEKSLVDEDAKKALDDAKAALAELNKPADPNSPQTGDNSNMFLWVALLFISGGAVITLTVVERKKRTLIKK